MALGKGSPNLKESNPIAAAEYAVARDIEDVLPFAWWLSITLTKRERIISDVKKSVLKKTHKFGTRVCLRMPRRQEELFAGARTSWLERAPTPRAPTPFEKDGGLPIERTTSLKLEYFDGWWCRCWHHILRVPGRGVWKQCIGSLRTIKWSSTPLIPRLTWVLSR